MVHDDQMFLEIQKQNQPLETTLKARLNERETLNLHSNDITTVVLFASAAVVL